MSECQSAFQLDLVEKAEWNLSPHHHQENYKEPLLDYFCMTDGKVVGVLQHSTYTRVAAGDIAL